MSYAQAKQRYEEANPADDRLDCRWCGKSSLRETLAHYGARCLECYERYARESSSAVCVGNKDTGGPKSWVAALAAREVSGMKLTGSQRDMLREAQGKA